MDPTRNLLVNLPVICFLVSTSIFFLLQQNVCEVTKLKVYIALLLIQTRLQNHHYNVTHFPPFFSQVPTQIKKPLMYLCGLQVPNSVKH